MPGPANVRSTDSIEAFRTALIRFGEKALAAVESMEAELRRTEEWVQHDRPSYWRAQVHAAEDGLHDAKMELERCLMMTVAGQRPACREQRQAVKDWQQRVEYCREKIERVRQWQRSYRQELLEHRGRLGELRRVLEFEVPEARGVLDKILRRIEEYQVEHAPAASTSAVEQPPGEASAASSRTRRVDEKATTVPQADETANAAETIVGEEGS